MSVLEHVANAPLAVAVVALACERVRAVASRAPVACSLLLPACWLVRAADVGACDALALVLVVALAAGTVLTLGSVAKGEPRLGLRDLLVGVALFLPLDLRWSYWIYPGGGGYTFWALGVTFLAVLGWGCAPRELPGFGHRPPTLRDLGVGVAALLAFSAIAIPLGYATHFLKRAPSLEKFDAGYAALAALGYVMTVALPEEVFFRGVLDRGLQATLRSRWLALAASSLAFGFMHWPRRDDLKGKLIYSLMGSIAGLFYAGACRKGGGLPAAVICHASVDWVWEMLWKR